MVDPVDVEVIEALLDEVVEGFLERDNVFLVPNLPDPGVLADMSWLSESIPADELQQQQTVRLDVKYRPPLKIPMVFI